MTSSVAILVLCSLGQQPIPQGPQPRFAIVHEIDKDRGEITLLQSEAVSKAVSVKSIEKGQEVTRMVVRQVLRSVPHQFSFDKGSVVDAAGKKIAVAEVWKRLKRGATVLMDNQQPDPQYLRVVQPDTLIFITSPLPKLPPPKVKRLPASV